MTKKILQLLVVLLITVQGVMGQTVSVVSLTNASPGDILVEVDMDGFTTSIGAITFYIEYDSDLLDFTGITNTSLSGTWLFNDYAQDMLTITYMTDGTANTPSGKVFDLQFYNYGGFSSDISFDEDAPEFGIVDQNLQPIAATYVDGSVTQGASVGTVSLGTAIDAVQGSTVTVPVTFEGAGFNLVNGISLTVSYDEASLVYTGVANNTLSGNFTATPANGVITITWSNITAEDFTTSTDVFELQFTYNGVGSSVLSFIPGCEITSYGSPLATTYENGLVTPYDSPYELTISEVAASSDSCAVTVPVVASGVAGTTMISAITVNISYSDSLTYIGYTAVQGSGWVMSSNTNNELTFSMYNSGFDIENGNLLTLNFVYDYDGGGIADIEFEAGCEFILTSTLAAAPVDYYDGYVSVFSDVNAKVFLQGAYNSGSMNTTINGYLPLSQPYSGSPWNYAGTETVTTMPTNVVDWVLVELRTGTAAATVVDTRAGLLLSDGSIVDTDGSSLLRFQGLEAGNYYIVVKHRFHLAIMSAAAQAIDGSSVLYDFTTSSSQSYGTDPLKDLGSGNWGLYSGDGNADGRIFPTDVTTVYFIQANQSGYKTGDWNMDGHVFPTDVTLIYFGNANKQTKVPN